MPNIKERIYEPAKALGLMRSGVPALLARLFAARGIERIEQTQMSLDSLLPYSGLANCERAAERLADAIQNQEEIVVVGDYDADGATATTVMVRALKAFGARVQFLIPHRITHEYGLTPAIVDVAAALSPRPSLLVTVDAGVSSFSGVARANSLGMQVLVTDHHLEAEEGLPDALMVVNPNQKACSFASKSLAGVGVAWYVMWALNDVLFERAYDFPTPEFSVTSLLPIVAVGTVADVVGLDQNNRILVSEGLRQIRCGKAFPGILALAAVAGRDPARLSTTDIGFGIGPRINAAGRLDSMNTGVECLLTDEPERARELAKTLNEINEERKDVEATVSDEATAAILDALDADGALDNLGYSIAVGSSDWHPGVIGIVAGRLKERYFRPTFVLAVAADGSAKGSGRSIPALHLRDALDLLNKSAPGVLTKFGGHAAAAGVSVAPGRLQDFIDAFEQVCQQLLKAEDLQSTLSTDGILEVDEMSLGALALVQREVWGQGFPPPLFEDVFQVETSRLIGDGKHLKLRVSKNGRTFDAVKFRWEGGAPPQGRVRAAYTMAENAWQGKTSLQLLIEHLEPA